VTSRTFAARQRAYAGFLAGSAGLATTARGVLEEDGDRLIRVGQVSRPTLGLLARYAPEYPCLLQGLAESNQTLGDAFSHGELHITLEVVLAQDAYRPGDEPQFADQSGPSCRGLPRPPVPNPPTHLADGTGGGAAGSAVPHRFDATSGDAGTAGEQHVVDPLVAPAMGTSASDVPDVATLLFGPMARGTAVGQQ
jgi:phospholipid/cholesterol/gamma-HCH transport system substrate-binding protein